MVLSRSLRWPVDLTEAIDLFEQELKAETISILFGIAVIPFMELGFVDVGMDNLQLKLNQQINDCLVGGDEFGRTLGVPPTIASPHLMAMELKSCRNSAEVVHGQELECFAERFDSLLIHEHCDQGQIRLTRGHRSN